MQPERFALHFQVPAVTHGATPEFAILGDLWRPVRPMDLTDSRSQCLQLLYQRFERLADTAQRGGALLHQLELDTSLALRGLATSHTVILPYDRGRSAFARCAPADKESGHYERRTLRRDKLTRTLQDILAAYQRDAPLEEASTIPADWYTDARVLDLERQTVFSRSW